MTNEDTFRTAEVRNGSVEPLMTTTNEFEPTLFRALKAPSNAGSGGQIRQNLELAAKLLPMAWSAFLFIGGLNFLFYYGTIGFMPELDLKASLTLLATSASIGTFLFIMVSAVLIGPALSWLGMAKHKTLKSLWYEESAEFPRPSTILWFIIPLASFSVASLLMFVAWQWLGNLSIHVGLPVSLGLILIITGLCLWRRLPGGINSRDKWAAMVSLLSRTFWSMAMFGPLLMFVYVIIANDPVYRTYNTIWLVGILVGIMVLILLFNGALVRASFFPVSKLLFAIVVALLAFSLPLPYLQLVPKASMGWFRFGNIQHASLILDEVGCNISRSYGLSVEKRVPDPKTCMLPDVMILSRLGTPYYIEMTGTPQKRLTIPAQNVLSWSVIESKKPPATGSP